MPHVALPADLPGIVAGFAFRPATAQPMRELAHILLHEPSTLSSGERELIATSVSRRNGTRFCTLSHGAAAAAHLGEHETVKAVWADPSTAPISAKLKTLLEIAGKVQLDGKLVTTADVATAREAGASDLEIHDTILIAAAFSMYNRYVDGLDTLQPKDAAQYVEMGRSMAEHGYREAREAVTR